MEDFEHAAKTCEKMRQALRAAIANVKKELLAGVQAAKSPQALYDILRDLLSRNGDVITWDMKVDEKQFYPMEAVAEYIFHEMMTNYRSVIADGIKKFNEQPAALRVLGRIDSYAIWIINVGPKMKWDHKEYILEKYGRFSHDSMSGKLYMYDIWSNIHYGFVGAAVSFTTWELTAGAAVANVISSLGESLIKYGKADDPRDQAAIMLGIDLWAGYGENLEFDTLMSAIRERCDHAATFECNYISGASP